MYCGVFFLFKGAFADAIAHLQNFSSTIKENMQLRSNLQMACCFYCLHRYSVSILNDQCINIEFLNKGSIVITVISQLSWDVGSSEVLWLPFVSHLSIFLSLWTVLIFYISRVAWQILTELGSKVILGKRGLNSLQMKVLATLHGMMLWNQFNSLVSFSWMTKIFTVHGYTISFS